MPTSIDFSEIPIFAFFSAEARSALAQSLKAEVRSKGELLLEFGKPTPGIYIIVEGEVEVRLPKAKGSILITRLSRGQCIGEMSLLEEAPRRASADIVTISPTLKTFFCSTKDFERLLEEVEGSASAFYRGAALQLSARLRKLNSKMNQELELGAELLSRVIEAKPVTDRETGSENFDRMTEQLAQIAQHFDKLRRVANGGSLTQITEDERSA